MTAKDKAYELFEKIWLIKDEHEHCAMSRFNAITCALITVDEILKSQPSYNYWNTYDDETPSAITFWNEVKEELSKL